MAQSELEVANAALYKLGATIVTSVTIDTSKEGTVIAARLEPCKRALLRMSPWNFAMTRKVLLPPTAVTLTTPFVTYVSANSLRLTVASHSFTTGQYITCASSGVSQATGTFEVTNINSGGTGVNVIVQTPGVSAITGTPAAGTIRLSPAFDYPYLYTLPTDCLKLISVNEELSSERWRVESRSIAADQDTQISIKYVKDVIEYTLMDILFYECLATYLAWDICDHITGSAAKKRDLWTDLHGGDGKVGMLPRAKFDDAIEDSLQTMSANDWLASRFGGDSTVILEPVTATQTAL